MSARSARVPDGTVVYAVGDIHGRLDLLDELLAAIREDAAQRAAERRVLVCLGDYVSRGPSSRQVIDRLRGAPLPGFETVTLKGNHEDLLLRFLEGDFAAGEVWLDYGGIQALAAYGVDASASAREDSACLPAIRDALALSLPAEHLGFLRGLALDHREGDYYFVHAGVEPGVALDEQTEATRMWIRRAFLSSQADHGAIVVHGHCISCKPEARPNRIGIDTGAYRSGILTCLALEGDRRDFLQTGARSAAALSAPER